jgi:hypothetical protein
MNYRVVANYDLSKFPEDQHIMLQGQLVLQIWPTREMAEWSAKGHREYPHSNIDRNSVRVIEVAE